MAALLSLPSCRVTCSKSDIPDYGMKEIEISSSACYARGEIGNKLSAVPIFCHYKYSSGIRRTYLIGKNERLYAQEHNKAH